MVALIKGGGSFVIHRDFLKANGGKTDQLPEKAMLGSVVGGAVYLSHANEQHFVICEGSETNLACLSGLLSESVTLIMGIHFNHWNDACEFTQYQSPSRKGNG